MTSPRPHATGASALGGRVLIVEDDRAIRELLQLHLSLAGLEVAESADGREALERLRGEAFDLVVLDIMLPHLDGIALCRGLRAKGANRRTPVLMMTARDSESDKVLGLESGADDYLTKPFGVREFMARVRAVMRRSRPVDDEPEAAGSLDIRGVTLDPVRRRATLRGQPLDLTPQEFEILRVLAARPGIVFSRAALLARVWQGDAAITERTVDTVVSRLRRKVERDPQSPELILTAWGVGYKFADAEM